MVRRSTGRFNNCPPEVSSIFLGIQKKFIYKSYMVQKGPRYDVSNNVIVGGGFSKISRSPLFFNSSTDIL